ncbi:MAG: BACON domain-containing protein [Bacteroidales bacterium]|nr:BACON domain-containing protein [Bacteroidales bacterium]
MDKFLKLLMALVMLLLPMMIKAQSSCDALFQEGQKLQQTMTVVAQNKAIALFQKAKACYDSAERKNICDQQIRTCRAIIQRLGSNGSTATRNRKNVEDTDTTSPKPKAEEPKKPVRTDIQLSSAKNNIEFKGKGGQVLTVKIKCNYEDWEVVEQPEWVTITSGPSAIMVSADENDTDEKRDGFIKIVCGDKSISIFVSQKKLSLFDKAKRKVGLDKEE